MSCEDTTITAKIEDTVSTDSFLLTDIGNKLILSLFISDIETLKKLYSMFPCFKILLNDSFVLKNFCQSHNIFSAVKNFPEFCCQYNIKYDTNCRFNTHFRTK